MTQWPHFTGNAEGSDGIPSGPSCQTLTAASIDQVGQRCPAPIGPKLSKVKSQCWKHTHEFDIELPEAVDEALKADENTVTNS